MSIVEWSANLEDGRAARLMYIPQIISSCTPWFWERNKIAWDNNMRRDAKIDKSHECTGRNDKQLCDCLIFSLPELAMNSFSGLAISYGTVKVLYVTFNFYWCSDLNYVQLRLRLILAGVFKTGNYLCTGVAQSENLDWQLQWKVLVISSCPAVCCWLRLFIAQYSKQFLTIGEQPSVHEEIAGVIVNQS